MKQKYTGPLHKIWQLLTGLSKGLQQGPTYRVIGVEETESGHYEVTAQMVGKGLAYKMNPEEILADDKLTSQFSSLDVRTLTYLGYLGINSPKYKILAQRLLDDERMIFMVHKKGSEKVDLKTAADLSKDADVLKHMDQKDAHLVGYALANEKSMDEKLQLTKLKQLTENKTHG